MTPTNDDIALIALEIAARPEQVRTAIDLLDDVSEIPFIERYRKDATGGLDDGQLRRIEECVKALRELATGRNAPKSIETLGELNDESEESSTGRTRNRKTKISDPVDENVVDSEPTSEGRRDTQVESSADNLDRVEQVHEDVATIAGQDGWRVKKRKTASAAEPTAHGVKPNFRAERVGPRGIGKLSSDTDLAKIQARFIEKAGLSPNAVKPKIPWKSLPRFRSWRLRALCWLTGVSTVSVAAALMLFTDDLRASFDGNYQIAGLNQFLTRSARETDEAGPSPAPDRIDAEADVMESYNTRLGAANASTLPEQASMPQADGATRLPARSSSQEMQLAEAARQLLDETDRSDRQRPPSRSDGPSGDPPMDQPGQQSHNEQRQTEIIPDGLPATIGQPPPKTETIQNLPTIRHQSGVDAEHWVQVAAMRSETEARRLWTPSQRDFGTVVTAMEPHFERSETPDGIIYKVKFGPFQAHHEAQDVCTWLAERNATCFVIIDDHR